MNKHKYWALPKLTVPQLGLLAVLMAASLAIGRLSITVGTLRISFVFLVTVLIARYYGPVWGLLIGVLLDFVKAVLLSGTGLWSPIMAAGVGLAGLIYGWGYYQVARPSWRRVLLVTLLITLVINMVINTFALMVMFSQVKSWSVFLTMLAGPRLLKSLIFFPIQTVLTYWLLNSHFVQRMDRQVWPR
ncbi:folate family ECF transporter S component [Leuconostocaceae bacterium ESL0958]|nr:folate family ECF transporter S component [Leuconostocaceae bacterium ESL0958]